MAKMSGLTRKSFMKIDIDNLLHIRWSFIDGFTWNVVELSQTVWDAK